ncbi:MAG: type II toxin-antitoxin system HicB family antitoxin [Candidatus Sabulitectum sp.]|nr:type II toxin-antitoxin system HicB family antitoxin [Candidatus Sabulitectum sp.]
MSKGNCLVYKGYTGSTEMSFEDNCLHGHIQMINDLVTYEAQSPTALCAEFEHAVDDYLIACEELGKSPDKPYSGSFNVRIGTELHKSAASIAHLDGISLNEFVKEAVRDSILRQDKNQHLYPQVSEKTPTYMAESKERKKC